MASGEPAVEWSEEEGRGLRKKPPTKKPGQALGRRRINGYVLDIATAAQFMGWPEKALRARVERGRVPYRRDGGRIVFIRDELETFLRRLPGVGLDEALKNERARGSGGDEQEVQP